MAKFKSEGKSGSTGSHRGKSGGADILRSSIVSLLIELCIHALTQAGLKKVDPVFYR